MKREKACINEVLAHFFPVGDWKIWTGPSGFNNTTRFLKVNDKQYVVRIYETHQDERKVRYEHAILLALKELPLAFGIPEPVMTIEGDTIVRTKDGKLASVFHFLDGENPQLTEPNQLYSFGKITGQLTNALAMVQINESPIYRPYYEIEHTHPHCSLDKVMSFCVNPSIEFAEQDTELIHIAKQIVAFQKIAPRLKLLPHQMVHGDLNASNILVNQEDIVSAVLDFEFVTNDLRAIELAVCLADFIRPDQEEAMIWTRIDAFLSGYGSVMKLTDNEIDIIPTLVQLRGLDVFIHFLGRYWDKVDSADNVKKQLYKNAIRANWLNSNKEKLIRTCRQRLL
ncbi:MAG TPA: phosphotransferase [Bacillus sp. (in: firmicutes)]|nr:phosphotransferase [Bacillus sp. (in: firmicutes)]